MAERIGDFDPAWLNDARELRVKERPWSVYADRKDGPGRVQWACLSKEDAETVFAWLRTSGGGLPNLRMGRTRAYRALQYDLTLYLSSREFIAAVREGKCGPSR